MEATMVHTDQFKLAGLKLAMRGTVNEPNNLRGVPDLWSKMRELMDQIPGRIGTDRFVLISGDVSEREPTAYYYALIQVSGLEEVPSEFETIDLSNKRIAYFVHSGPPTTSGTTAMSVLHSWLPESGESIQENLEIMRLAESYRPGDADSSFEYGIFI